MKSKVLLIIIFLITFCGKVNSWSGSTTGNIYYNQRNVGSGTASSGTKLHFLGSDEFSGIGIFVLITSGGIVLKLGGNINYSWMRNNASKPLYINELENYISIIYIGGKIKIDTTNPEANQSVKGKIIASEIRVKTILIISDYVFKYVNELTSLNQMEGFEKRNKYLSQVESGKKLKEKRKNLLDFKKLRSDYLI